MVNKSLEINLKNSFSNLINSERLQEDTRENFNNGRSEKFSI